MSVPHVTALVGPVDLVGAAPRIVAYAADQVLLAVSTRTVTLHLWLSRRALAGILFERWRRQGTRRRVA